MSDTFGRTVTAATGPAGGMVAAGNADGQQELVRELRHAVRGMVRGDPGVRALYATDASNYRQLPIAVVLPRDTDDVVAAVGVCRTHGVPRAARAARAAAQTYTLAEFLETRTPGWTRRNSISRC